MRIIPVVAGNRDQVNEFIRSHWFSTDMIVRGDIVDMRTVDGLVAYEDDAIIGLVTYRIKDYECELLSLDSVREGQGIGTALVNRVVSIAAEAVCARVKLITTNDNINAIRFYQKRGFDLVRLYHNSIDAARKLKPSIPLLGNHDIPIKHELEFVLSLENQEQ